MDLWTTLLNLLVLLGAAMVLGTIAERLKQSAIVGYLLAGVLLGPNAFDVITADEGISDIAQLGVTLLMFTIGLEFSWSKLKSLGATALLSGTTQIVGTGGLAAGVALLAGVGPAPATLIGAVVALSSTGVVMPVLARRSEVESVHGRFALGILLVQDAAVVPLVLIVTALGGEGSVSEVLIGTALSFGVVALFILGAALFTKFALPILVRFSTPTRNREVPILFAIVAAMGSAWLAQSFGLSAALGAFIAAIFLGESVIATQLRGDLGPLKTVFVTLFFSAIGMVADPMWIAAHPVAVGLTVLGVLFGKPVVVSLVGLLMRMPVRHAVAAGACMSQIGVFSFVLAQVAATSGVISDDLFNLLVSAMVVTLFTTPYAVGLAIPIGRSIERWMRNIGLGRSSHAEAHEAEPDEGGHVVVIGFGPAGRAVALPLKDAKVPIVVIDLNPQAVMYARSLGMRAFVGDASSPDLLQLINAPNAAAVVVTLPDYRAAEAIIRGVRGQCDSTRILCRARYHRYATALDAAGAHVVVDEEESVGNHLQEAVAELLPTRKAESVND